MSVDKSLAMSLYTYMQTLQSVQYRDRSTMTVSTRVFLAPVPVKSLTKSALHCVPEGVGVLLAQCLMKRLMLVSMRLTAPKKVCHL